MKTHQLVDRLFDLSMIKKKILFILPSTSVGGAETQAILLAKSMSGNYDVSILCFHIDEEYVINNRIKGSKIKLHIIQSHGLFGRGIRYFRYLLLLWFLITHRYSVIMPYLDEMNLNTGLVKYLLPHIVIVWNQRDAGLAKFSFKLARKSVRKYNAFISNSKEGAEFLINRLNAPENKIAIIPNGISVANDKSKEEWRLENGFGGSDFLVCMLANLQENKDHMTLLKSWKQIEGQIENCKLLLVGYKGSTYRSIEQFINDNNLQKVIIYGKTNEPANLLNAMDISILSSKSEGLSNTMLETLFLGVPFVGTKITGITQVLGEDYPFLFDYMNSEELTSIIIDIYNNQSKAQNIAKTIHKKVSLDYSVKALYDRTMDCLDSFIID